MKFYRTDRSIFADFSRFSLYEIPSPRVTFSCHLHQSAPKRPSIGGIRIKGIRRRKTLIQDISPEYTLQLAKGRPNCSWRRSSGCPPYWLSIVTFLKAVEAVSSIINFGSKNSASNEKNQDGVWFTYGKHSCTTHNPTQSQSLCHL